MDYFKYTINEDEWTIYIVDDDDHVAIEDGAYAETDFESKELHFRQGSVYFACILHELFHVYMGYCYLGDTTSMTLSDYEEVSAAMFADKAERIILRAKEIEQKLIQLRDNKKDSSSEEEN